MKLMFHDIKEFFFIFSWFFHFQQLLNYGLSFPVMLWYLTSTVILFFLYPMNTTCFLTAPTPSDSNFFEMLFKILWKALNLTSLDSMYWHAVKLQSKASDCKAVGTVVKLVTSLTQLEKDQYSQINNQDSRRKKKMKTEQHTYIGHKLITR